MGNGAGSDDPASKVRKTCKPYAPIMACTDCGFGTAAGANNLTRELVFKKIGTMCAGAKLLEEELAAEEAEALGAGIDKMKLVGGAEEMPTLNKMKAYVGG